MIYFTKHAIEKFEILERHNCRIDKTQVSDTINNPDKIDYSRTPLLIAQKQISALHVLRVVYREENNIKLIITFYPSRAKKYE